jgi:hypothetical protein
MVGLGKQWIQEMNGLCPKSASYREVNKEDSIANHKPHQNPRLRAANLIITDWFDVFFPPDHLTAHIHRVKYELVESSPTHSMI